MVKYFKHFWKDEAGAVSADWAVLTATVVGLALSAHFAIRGNTEAVLSMTGNAVLAAQEFPGGSSSD